MLTDDEIRAELTEEEYTAWEAGRFIVIAESLVACRIEKRELKARFTAPIVCLCGSGRFKDAYEKAEFEETLNGKIVLTIGCNTHDIARSEELKKHKAALDELHKRKIDLADEILVLDIGGYIGESTQSEIEYAQKIGRKIRYLSSETAALLKDGEADDPIEFLDYECAEPDGSISIDQLIEDDSEPAD